MHCEFSLRHYEETLEAALELGYRSATFSEVKSRGPREKTLLLRHDIDVALAPAKAMADIEGRLGVRSTYFFRLHAEGFNLYSWDAQRFVHQLIGAGAEVALQSEAGLEDDVGGCGPAATLANEKQVMEVMTGGTIAGVSFHMPSRAVSIDAELVRAVGFRYEAGERAFNEGFRFLSDSNQRWKSQAGCLCANLGCPGSIYAAIHPIWWTTPPEEVEGIVERLRAGQ